MSKLRFLRGLKSWSRADLMSWRISWSNIRCWNDIGASVWPVFCSGQVLCLSDDWYTMTVMILFSYCLSWDQNFWPWRRWKSRLGSCTISALDVLECFGVCLLLNSDNSIYIYIFVLVWFPFNESLYQSYIYSVEVVHVFLQYHCGSLPEQPPEDHEPGWWWDETSKGQVGGAIFSCDKMGEWVIR